MGVVLNELRAVSGVGVVKFAITHSGLAVPVRRIIAPTPEDLRRMPYRDYCERKRGRRIHRLAFGDFVQAPIGLLTNGTAVTIAFGSNVTAGNTLFAFCRLVGGEIGATVTVTDSLSQTWTQDATQNQTTANYPTFMHRFSNTAGGACTVTFTKSGAAVNFRYGVIEVSGNCALDGTVATAQGDVSTTAASGNVAVASASPLLVGFATTANNRTFTAGSSFTNRMVAPADPSARSVIATYQPGSAGTYPFTETWTTNDNWTAICGGYNNAGVGRALITNINQAPNRASRY